MPRTLRILVVEDDRDSGDVLGVLLRGDGFNVCVAHSGEEAVAISSAFRPDVVMLDLMMPGTDGFMTARRLQQQPSSQRVAYVAYSGLHTPQVLAKCKELGIEHFILKPATIERIEDVLRTIVAQRAATNASADYTEWGPTVGTDE